MVDQAGRIAVLSGAGISTASGIPDFRSPTGLYAKAENANVFELNTFQREPEHFYEFARSFYPMVRNAPPNAAHRALAAWEQAGKEIHIATQNIDDLHERAGSRQVYYVHGSILTSTCQHCFRRQDMAAIEPDILAGRVPHCACGGVMKPNITFFGEPLPDEDWARSAEAVSTADLVVVVGTSLVVHPAAGLPNYRRDVAEMVIINRDPTYLDRMADLVSHDDIVAVFTATDRLLSGR